MKPMLHYQLIDKLGEGGMGEVWRARDTTLDREVAIKMLPEAFSGDPERLARFEREAKLLASLNHPNIAAIYGLHEAEGQRFLAMELVPGVDLAERIEQGAIPVAEATPIARQIAEALEAAHEQGVIHRDLKPANVKLTPDGTVKVLDFGLAKALHTGAASGESPTPTLSPTVTSAGSVAGVILGTASYMSPEQARGQPVDRRADVWSLGCVLFEMLAGQRAFAGSTVSDALASILAREPDWAQLPSATPPPLRRLIERCLNKDSRMRLRDIGEARIALMEIGDSPLLGQSPDAVATKTGLGLERIGWLALLVILAGVAIWQFASSKSTAPTTTGQPAGQFTLRRLTDLAGPERHPDLSPDGRQLIYSSRASGNDDIYLLRVSGQRTINLTADSEASDTAGAFSPDGESIAFRSERDGGGLFVMGATGESVRRVTDFGFDPAWSPDGKQLVFGGEAVDDPYIRPAKASLWTVDLATGAATQILDETDQDGVQPKWSPSGERIAYWSNPTGQRDILTVAASGGEPVPVTQDRFTDWSPVWSPDGRWLYFSSDRSGSMNLWRVQIDQTTGETAGEPEPVTTSVREIGHAAFSRDGSRIAVMAYDRTFDLDLYELDAAAGYQPELKASLRRSPTGWCSASGDGEWLACATWGAQEDLVIMRADGSELRRLMDDHPKDRHPIWSPDGEQLLFMSTRSGRWELWRIAIDGSGLTQLTDVPDMEGAIWSPDSTRVVTSNPKGDQHWMSDVAEGVSKETWKLPCEPPFVISAWSPDGKQLGGKEPYERGVPPVWKICDTETGTYRTLKSPQTAKRYGGIATWLSDGTTVLARGVGDVLDTGDDRLVGIVAYDTRADEPRVLMPLTSGDILKYAVGDRILIERIVLDSEIWLLTAE